MKYLITVLTSLLTLVIIWPAFVFSQQAVKNVIILIPDGTSTDVLSIARWYQGNTPLAVDEIICGMIKTHSVDSTIADSAPTSTAYATGRKTKAGFIGMLADSTPVVSVLELSRKKGLSTGLVFTCQFPHATPADFVCHHYNRNAYDLLAKQFLFNSPDVVFGGGYYYLEHAGLRPAFDSLHYSMINNINDFRNISISKTPEKPIWSLFDGWMNAKKYMSYDCDRDSTREPSIAEMTEKAIQVLSNNKKGFFLMVEGSQVDWAAHNNDPKATVTDFLAFDKAVKIALEFAKKDKQTLVIVCPDHANGGISLGSAKGASNTSEKWNIYNGAVIPLQKARHSARWAYEEMLIRFTGHDVSRSGVEPLNKFLSENYNIILSEKDAIEVLNDIKQLKAPAGTSTTPSGQITDKIYSKINSTLSNKASIGWTGTNHTGDDVFLGIYHPGNDRITGIIDNTEIGKYISKQLKLNLPDK